MDALAPLGRELLTFGFGFGAEARVRGVNVHYAGRSPSMDVLYDGKPFCRVALRIPGAHNLVNALAAATAGIALGLPPQAIEEGLCGYTGVGRRFEFKGRLRGADVYDDYAHHPKELRATLDTVFSLGYKRVVVAFQPHTYSRTQALFPDFVTELSRPDVTFLAPVYAARESKDAGVASDVLAAAIPNARHFDTFDELSEALAAVAQEGDIILTIGAGDVYKVGETLVPGSK
jgi:UDP-N-acetylmuramate--alanine ligase